MTHSPKLFKVVTNANVEKDILDDEFWVGTARVSDLLKPLATAIRYHEGDHVSVSVMPRVWGQITGQMCRDNLIEAGWSEEEVTMIVTAINEQMNMNIRPVTVAANV